MTDDTVVEEVVEEETPLFDEETEIHLAVSGITLRCQPVQTGVLQKILADLAVVETAGLKSPEKIGELWGPERTKAIQSSEQLFNYCAGWGIVNDPPFQVPEVVQLLGVNRTQPNLYRAAWIRYALEATQEELGHLVGVVMTLSFKTEASSNGQE